RPDRDPAGAGRDPSPRARPDPVRPDAGVTVHVLPRRGGHHGGRPGSHAALRAHHPDLRGRALSNFGTFGTPERELVFDINDFDETLPGPWEWDVKRLVASLAIAGRNNGFKHRERTDIELHSVGEYRTAMREFAGMGNLDVWYSKLQVQEILPEVRAGMDRKSWKAAGQAAEKAHTRDNIQAFSKLTHEVDGE